MSFTIRTIDEIFQEALQEKQTFGSLDGLIDGGITSENTLIPLLTNGTAPNWVLFYHSIAVLLNLTDISIQTGINDITALFDNQKVPTLPWYINLAKQFQYGDSVIIDPVTYQLSYSLIDTSKQIIGSVTTTQIANRVYLKIRRKDTDILSTDELNSFTAYINKAKAAGDQVIIQNYSGDLLTLNIDIIYDPIYSLATIKSNVESAINNYIENLEFDSKFISNKLVDILQDIDGVIDPRFNESYGLNSLGVLEPFRFEYTTTSGWAVINEDYPLSDTINYIVRS